VYETARERSAKESNVVKQSIGAQTFLHPAPVLVVGTYDAAGKANAMTVAWGGICCSVPPCISISLRPATYSHGNLVARRAFTVSIPSEKHVRATDFFGMASGKAVDKFAVTGLTPVRSDLVDAPYVGEFPVVLECRLKHTLEIGGHTQFVGEILDVKVDGAALDETGKPKFEQLLSMAYGGRRYWSLGGAVAEAFSVGRELM
jgi:flavin reductase (DIM6/NTAB) family NADH-FMN oxidoreductase RutF